MTSEKVMCLHEAIQLVRTGNAKAFFINVRGGYYYTVRNRNKNDIVRWDVSLGPNYFEATPHGSLIESISLATSLSSDVLYAETWGII